jgi:hypothetical protein
MKILLTMAIIFCGLLNTIELALAQTWTPTSVPTNYWSSIACSADGSKLVAVAGSNPFYTTSRISPIYISTNYGSTWTPNTTTSNYWMSVASSADGNRLIAVGDGQIYMSTNGGTTWFPSGPSTDWISVASSADGSKLFVLSSSGQSLFSTNSRSSLPMWFPGTVPNGARAIASSADGTRLVAAHGGYPGGQIFTSTNSGITWMTNNSPSESWWSVASSADGTKLAGVDGDGGPAHIYTSMDSGTTWVTNNVPLLSWQYIAMSADGTKLIAAAWVSSGLPTGPIYTSTNSGLTWTSNNVPNVTWQGVACSADGNEFVAVSAGNGIYSQGTGQIWISQTTPNPVLNLTPSDTNLALSWLVPSTNFALQQNLDLTTTNWTTLTNEPTLNLTNLDDEVMLPQTNSSSFFRLIAQ